MKEKPNIYSYTNYREYLKDLFAFFHAADKKFTKSYICKAIGLPNSRSYFQNILNGRPLSQTKMMRFIEVFKMNPKEGRFFRLLVNYNQSSNDLEAKNIFFDNLLTFSDVVRETITIQSYAYYKEWYPSAIRALLDVVNFRSDGNYLNLSKKVLPNITEKEAKETVKLLLELGLVQPNAKGFLKPTKKSISTGSYAKSDIILQHQLKSLEASKKVMLENKQMDQRIMMKMLSVSSKAYKKILQRMEQFNKEVNTIVQEDDEKADRVYQLGNLLVPKSRKGSQK